MIELSKCIYLIDEVYIVRCDVTKKGIKSLADALVTSNHHVSCKIEFKE